MARQPIPKPDPEPDPEEDEPAQAPTVELPQQAPAPIPPKHQQTFGEKAVGLSFNPSGDPDVTELKRLYAKVIDLCHGKRLSLMAGSEAHRLWAVAITTAQDAQMWGVKAATWKD